MFINEFKKDNWFQAKRIGFGWTPSNVWGWGCVIAFLVQFLLNLYLIVYINIRYDIGFIILTSIINMIMAVSFLLIISFKTSKK